MLSTTLYAIISVVVVSLISVIAALPLVFKKKMTEPTLVFLLSLSVGVLLSAVFLDFLPEIEEQNYTLTFGIIIIAGFLLMFVLEKFVHWHHSKKCENGDCGHGHAYNLAPVNLIGDSIHNFIDGLVIAGSYAVSVTVGIAATISIIFHEIPQEIADFGVLLYSGLSRKRALLFNFLSATTAILGTVIGLVLVSSIEGFTRWFIPFAAGNFLYIAASNLLPQLHRHCKVKDSLMHLFAILLGVGIILLVTVLGPGHGHG
ncbi:MAG: ZIP family metal transporter [Nanoarchaeota archaeon]